MLFKPLALFWFKQQTHLATFPATKPRLHLHCKAVSSDICNQRLSEVTAFDSRVILFVAIRASSCSANQKLISQAAPVVSVLFRSGFKIAGHKVKKPLSSSAYGQQWYIEAGAAKTATGSAAGQHNLEAVSKVLKSTQQKIEAPPTAVCWAWNRPTSAGSRNGGLGVRLHKHLRLWGQRFVEVGCDLEDPVCVQVARILDQTLHLIHFQVAMMGLVVTNWPSQRAKRVRNLQGG